MVIGKQKINRRNEKELKWNRRKRRRKIVCTFCAITFVVILSRHRHDWSSRADVFRDGCHVEGVPEVGALVVLVNDLDLHFRFPCNTKLKGEQRTRKERRGTGVKPLLGVFLGKWLGRSEGAPSSAMTMT